MSTPSGDRDRPFEDERRRDARRDPGSRERSMDDERDRDAYRDDARDAYRDDDRDGPVYRDDGRDRARDRDVVVEREREAYGGLKMGAAFFGWLTAMGMAVLLTALLAAVGAAVGLGTGTTVEEATEQAQRDPAAIGWAGVVGLLVILFVSYFAGGYVAGRMARFDGVKQGLGVWLWALIAAVVVAVLGLVAGDQFNLLQRINGFPRIPVGEGDLSTVGIVAAVLAALVPLVAAVLGGKAGMRFHRKVDDAGLGLR